MKKILLLLFIFLFSASPSFAKFDPAFTWTTLETPHFSIHYHQGEEELAKRTAVIAEDVHARLVPRIKWEPKGRTHMVLVDAMDDTNGLTTVFPYNHITLFITRPVGEPGFGTMVYDEWMRTLITHEYTHILHLDMVNGVTGLPPVCLRQTVFPEPVRAHLDDRRSCRVRGDRADLRRPRPFARLRDGHSHGRARGHVSAPEPGRGVPRLLALGARCPYLFGEGFTRYIAGKYGREKLADIYVSYSRFGIPWLVDLNGRWTLKSMVQRPLERVAG